MLGFSPLASAPLGDDGVTADIIYIINGVGITTGQPVVGASTAVLTTTINADSITTGQPVVGSSDVVQDHDLNLTAISTGQPSVPSVILGTIFDFAPASITTGHPIVGSLAINASGRRVVSVTGNSINNVTLSETYNSATVSYSNKVA